MMNRAVRKFAHIAGNAVVALAVLVLIAALVMAFMNIKPAVVVSGSMEPVIHKGSLVMIDGDYKADVNENDIIAFRAGDMTVIHRVAEVTDEGYITKGDANEDCDPGILKKDRVKGRVVMWIPLAGGIIR